MEYLLKVIGYVVLQWLISFATDLGIIFVIKPFLPMNLQFYENGTFKILLIGRAETTTIQISEAISN